MLLELSSILNIPTPQSTVKCTVFEDNEGAKELANNPKYRPRTKHIAVKYHHFRQHVKNGLLLIKSIDTKEQLADIFTKGIPRVQFEYLRSKIQGWLSILTKPSQSIEDFYEAFTFVT